MDPTMEQWKQISEIAKERNLLPFFDCAYQGFASGDADKDAEALRMFVDDGHLMCMIQSFSKSFGLYGHRIGTLSVVGADEDSGGVMSLLLSSLMRKGTLDRAAAVVGAMEFLLVGSKAGVAWT